MTGKKGRIIMKFEYWSFTITSLLGLPVPTSGPHSFCMDHEYQVTPRYTHKTPDGATAEMLMMLIDYSNELNNELRDTNRKIELLNKSREDEESLKRMKEAQEPISELLDPTKAYNDFKTRYKK